MREKLDEWSISYYLGALDSMKDEVLDLDGNVDSLERLVRLLRGRVKQLEAFFRHAACGTWRKMEDAPRDGRPVLLRWPDGRIAVGREVPGGWRIWPEPLVVVKEEPEAWAEILCARKGRSGRW